MNKKGITMVSLIFYVLSFFVIVSVIGSIGIYITKNMDTMSLGTDSKYAQNQIDKYLRKFFNRKDNYEISLDYNNDSQYITFTRFDVENEVNVIKYIPETLIIDKGFVFLEVLRNGTLVKKIVIAENIVGLNIYESESGLGKLIEVELSVLEGEDIAKVVSSYGVER